MKTSTVPGACKLLIVGTGNQGLGTGALKLLQGLTWPWVRSLQPRPGGTRDLASSPLPQSELE